MSEGNDFDEGYWDEEANNHPDSYEDGLPADYFEEEENYNDDYYDGDENDEDEDIDADDGFYDDPGADEWLGEAESYIDFDGDGEIVDSSSTTFMAEIERILMTQLPGTPITSVREMLREAMVQLDQYRSVSNAGAVLGADEGNTRITHTQAIRLYQLVGGGNRSSSMFNAGWVSLDLVTAKRLVRALGDTTQNNMDVRVLLLKILTKSSTKSARHAEHGLSPSQLLDTGLDEVLLSSLCAVEYTDFIESSVPLIDLMTLDRPSLSLTFAPLLMNVLPALLTTAQRHVYNILTRAVTYAEVEMLKIDQGQSAVTPIDQLVVNQAKACIMDQVMTGDDRQILNTCLLSLTNTISGKGDNASIVNDSLIKRIVELVQQTSPPIGVFVCLRYLPDLPLSVYAKLLGHPCMLHLMLTEWTTYAPDIEQAVYDYWTSSDVYAKRPDQLTSGIIGEEEILDESSNLNHPSLQHLSIREHYASESTASLLVRLLERIYHIHPYRLFDQRASFIAALANQGSKERKWAHKRLFGTLKKKIFGALNDEFVQLLTQGYGYFENKSVAKLLNTAHPLTSSSHIPLFINNEWQLVQALQQGVNPHCLACPDRACRMALFRWTNKQTFRLITGPALSTIYDLIHPITTTVIIKTPGKADLTCSKSFDPLTSVDTLITTINWQLNQKSALSRTSMLTRPSNLPVLLSSDEDIDLLSSGHVTMRDSSINPSYHSIKLSLSASSTQHVFLSPSQSLLQGYLVLQKAANYPMTKKYLGIGCSLPSDMTLEIWREKAGETPLLQMPSLIEEEFFSANPSLTSVLKFMEDKGLTNVDRRLTAMLKNQLWRPMVLTSGSLPPHWSILLSKYPWLFDRAARVTVARALSCGVHRALTRAQQILGKEFAMCENSHSNDSPCRVRRLDRCTLDVDRAVLDQSITNLPMIPVDAVLEITYQGEPGIGQGPTLEFYTLVSEWFMQPQQGLIQLKDGAWYPSSEMKHPKLLAHFLHRAWVDEKILAIDFSPALFAALSGRFSQEHVISLMDPDLVDLFINHPQKLLGLTLTDLPAPFIWSSSKKRSDTLVINSDNLVAYVKDALISITATEVISQMISVLQNFQWLTLPYLTPTDMTWAFCGDSKDHPEQWNKVIFLSSIKCDHGYTLASAQVQWLADYVQERAARDSDTKKRFIEFMTGASKLPREGTWSSLEPLLTIVPKKSEHRQQCQELLPSVMTCVNYLKLPMYNTREHLFDKLDQAIHMASRSFYLS